jgi:hypothetical protein
MNKISSDELSGNNSHFNAGINESITTKRSNKKKKKINEFRHTIRNSCR